MSPNLVAFDLAGPGWVWVDQSRDGFALRDFVFFGSHVTFGGRVDLLSFDPRADAISFAFHPEGRPRVNAAHAGSIETHSDSMLGLAFQIVSFGIAGALADDAATSEAEQQLSSAFGQRLTSDMTATIDLRSGQFDFVQQPLQAGLVPIRPFSDPLPDGDHFVLNEQQELHPGMPRIAGPIPPAAGALVDFNVEGAPVRYRAECRSRMEAPLDRSLPAGHAPLLPPPLPQNSGVVYGRETRAVLLACPWYLVTYAQTATTVQVRVHGQTFLGPPVR